MGALRLTGFWPTESVLPVPVLAALIVLAVLPAAIAGDLLVGIARPIDGDTFELGEVVVRLADIDAPEVAQRCLGGPKALRRCGSHVADLLAERLHDRPVSCEVLEIDQYERRIARCNQDGEDLSSWLVSHGWALAYREFSSRFIDEEEAARTQGLGLWQTEFEAPWDYRAHRWEVAAQKAPDGCPIKGNISRDGAHIYHTPWGSQWYERTRISLKKGERWFCSEREALDAGWRAPLH